MTDPLYNNILSVLEDGKFHYAQEFCQDGKYSILDVKLFLLELLKEKYVLCNGRRWKLLINREDLPEFPQETVSYDIYVVCPACQKRLQIQPEFIGMKAECTVCETEFFISTRQNKPDEYETIAVEQVQNEE